MSIDRFASDIHIDLQKDLGIVRFRIKGYLSVFAGVPPNLYRELISKIKVLSSMRIDGLFMQDGRMCLGDFSEYDFRVSVIPGFYGESCVIRINKNNSDFKSLDDIGFVVGDIQKIRDLVFGSGLVIVSGPTGSGKTTTLYSIVNEINDGKNLIITVEDPVERVINGTRQIQVRDSSGISFSSVLRTILRQDPDIILIGEIRDRETARIAINSALTGHLVLATLHTRDAGSVIYRLREFDIDEELIKATLKLSIHQRLIGVVCSVCSKEIYFDGRVYYSGECCDKCDFVGLEGKRLISEVMKFDFKKINNILNMDELYSKTGTETLRENILKISDSTKLSYLDIREIFE